MKKIILISLLVIFVSLCVGVTGYLYVKDKKNPEVFKTDSVVVADIYKKVVATGSIEPRKEVLIKPQVSGIIEKLFVKAGEDIKKGDVIAKIKIIAAMANLNNAETQVNTAKINLETSEAEYKRRKKLYEDKVIAHADYITYEQDYRIKKEQLESAESNMELIKKGSSKRITQTTTLVRATIDGKILDIPIKEGSSVIESNNFNDGTTVATLANMKDLIFKGKVVESEVGKLQEGLDLNLQIGAFTDEVYKAKLEFISSKGADDKGAIQFEIKAGIVLPKESKRVIRAGYSASADIILDRKEKVLTIHEKNIEFKGDSHLVYIETQPQIFVKKNIKTGLSDDLIIEVVDGLKEKDKIKILENK